MKLLVGNKCLLVVYLGTMMKCRDASANRWVYGIFNGSLKVIEELSAVVNFSLFCYFFKSSFL